MRALNRPAPIPAPRPVSHFIPYREAIVYFGHLPRHIGRALVVALARIYLEHPLR